MRDFTHLTPALGPDDTLDPKTFHDRRTRRGDGRKALQLCEQVRHALTAALAGLGDEALQAVTVLGVEPAPHSGRLRATVTAPDRKLAEARLLAAAGRLRTEVAAAVNRRKAPELMFAVIGGERPDKPHTIPAMLSLRIGLVGAGMIADETHLPAIRQAGIELVGVATRTARRAADFPTLFHGPDAVPRLLASGVDAVIVATPDDRHFAPAKLALLAGKHVLIEKPSVLTLAELDELTALAERNDVLAKVVYHKLLDPDHKMLRTRVLDGVLTHVNSGYCTLLEPRSISTGQFAEWVTGRNPGTYVGVHYLKLIDFTFGPAWRLTRITATGQRGLVGPADGPTWDAVQQRVTYTHSDGREATFDIHTDWVTPDDFPGYVEQEVQFRFDTGVWSASQRKRGVEVCGPGLKPTPNHHYNAAAEEPWGGRERRGYGVEAVARFFAEVRAGERHAYNDLASDRNVVAAVQATEAVLAAHAAESPGGVVTVNDPAGGLVLRRPGVAGETVLYHGRV